MKRLEVRLRWAVDDEMRVAEIADDRGTILVEFDQLYLDASRATGLDLAPLRLLARAGLHRHPPGSGFGPLPGLFDDSMPDAWGLRLMDRVFRAAGVDTRRLSALDRLAWLGSTTMGALTYHPATSRQGQDPLVVHLAAVAGNAAAVVRGSSEAVLPILQRAGGSPGGARPKVLVGIGPDEQLVSGEADLPEGFSHWIVKFAAPGDEVAAAQIEAAYLRMAADAGVEACDARLLRDDSGAAHLAVRRFDRMQVGGATHRLHTATVSGLLHADHRLPSIDYATLLALVQRLTRDHRQVEEAFRRMVFNVAAHNRDDHTKNVSFTMDRDGRWSLAPAYDLTWSAGPGGQHTMDVAGKGTGITREDVLAVAARASLRPGRGAQLVDQVCDAVARWPEQAAESGIDAATARRVGADHQLAPLRA